MNNDTKIRYTFHNQHDETIEMTFTILEVEGTAGGFMSEVTKTLNEMDFGDVTEVERALLIG